MKIGYNFLSAISGNKRLIDEHFPNFKQILKDITQRLVNEGTDYFSKALSQKKLKVMEKPVQCAMDIMDISDDVRNKL